MTKQFSIFLSQKFHSFSLGYVTNTFRISLFFVVFFRVIITIITFSSLHYNLVWNEYSSLSSLFICNNNENICNDTFYEAKCSLNNVSPLCILPQAYLTILPERCIYRRLQKVLQAMLSSLQKIRKYKLATIILNGHFKCELKTYIDSLIRIINCPLFSSYMVGGGFIVYIICFTWEC